MAVLEVEAPLVELLVDPFETDVVFFVDVVVEVDVDVDPEVEEPLGLLVPELDELDPEVVVPEDVVIPEDEGAEDPVEPSVALTG